MNACVSVCMHLHTVAQCNISTQIPLLSGLSCFAILFSVFVVRVYTVCIAVCVGIYVYVRTYVLYIHSQVHACTHIHTCAHTHTHARTRAHTHTHTHTHTLHLYMYPCVFQPGGDIQVSGIATLDLTNYLPVATPLRSLDNTRESTHNTTKMSSATRDTSRDKTLESSVNETPVKTGTGRKGTK